MSSAEKSEDFYNWFKDMGGCLTTESPEDLINNINKIPLQRNSTLKIDPKATKEKHNYKFRQNENY